MHGIYIILILIISTGTLFCQSKKESTFHITFNLKTRGLSNNDTVYITGSLQQLGPWNPAKVSMTMQNDSTWIRKITIRQAKFIEYKFTLGSWQEEAADSNGLPLPNFKANITADTIITHSLSYWTSKTSLKRKSTITGTVKYHYDFKGEAVLPRDVLVWLPPDYDKDSTKSYPVLYMHDGQNVFDTATSSFGNEWRTDEICDSLINAGKMNPLIVVAINNTTERSTEYLPGQKGKAYMDFIVNELKPFIDKTYRTKPFAGNTVVAGSSAGGTISFMLAWAYPHVFSKAICMSPAFRIDEIDYVKEVMATKDPRDVFFYIDNGGLDLEKRLQPGIDAMSTALKAKGYQQGKDFKLIIDPAALHNEVAWAKRLPHALELCFPSQ